MLCGLAGGIKKRDNEQQNHLGCKSLSCEIEDQKPKPSFEDMGTEGYEDGASTESTDQRKTDNLQADQTSRRENQKHWRTIQTRKSLAAKIYRRQILSGQGNRSASRNQTSTRDLPRRRGSEREEKRERGQAKNRFSDKQVRP
jgi:hypothetical protein